MFIAIARSQSSGNFFGGILCCKKYADFFVFLLAIQRVTWLM